MECTSCKRENRTIARYCKECGHELPIVATSLAPAANGSPAVNGSPGVNGTPEEPEFSALIGIPDVKRAYQRAVTAFRHMRQAGLDFDKRGLYTLLMGNTGTGKSKIVEVLAKVFYKAGITTKADPVILPATRFAEWSKDVKAGLDAAKGAILFIDNTHQLLGGGASSPGIDKLMVELDKRDGDPIVILGSNADGLRNYLVSNPEVNNRFGLQFYLPEMAVDQMCELAERSILISKFTLSDEARARLKKRLLYLFRQEQDGEKALSIGKNGFLVNKEVKNLITEHFSKPTYQVSAARQLEAEDITGPVAEIKTIEEVLKQLDDFVGMAGVKDYIRNLMNLLEVQRKDAELTGKKQVFGSHMVLTGNPGTGKTTLAMVLGEVFLSAGLLSSGHVVNADRSTLVGQYVGETAKLVQKACDEAMGGILLVDEAYALKQSDQDHFGQEAIDTLLKRMEDDRDKFVVIAAGYQKEMQNFINANPGMKSRVKDNFFHLDDYTPDQLLEILKIFIRKGGYKLEEAAEKKAATLLQNMYKRRTKEFGNGRDVRNLFDSICTRRATRLMQQGSGYSMDILAADIPGDETDLSEERITGLLSELNALTGLEEVKSEIANLVDFLQGQRMRTEAGGKASSINLHFVFTGNPGTGKTTVARILAGLLKGLGLLPKGQLVEVTDKDLVVGYTSQTAANTNKVIDTAMGGVLFIDEAYTLTPRQGSFGGEAIDTLLKRMEDDRGKFIVIAAGYTKEMQDFLDGNPGLDSRFTKKINFADYPPDALYTIICNMIRDGGLRLGEGVADKLRAYIEKLYSARDKRFANARTMRNEYEKLLQTQAARLVRSRKAGMQPDVMEIQVEDIPGAAVAEESPAALLAELNGLIGLRSVKRELQSLMAYLEMEKMRMEQGGKGTSLNLHFVFKGAPGTGKTTVARILARIFKGLSLLSSGQLIEVDRSNLVGQYIGTTAPLTAKVIDQAMGGVLFIDEAYSLMPTGATNDFGKEAIDTLLKRMEDDKGKFIVIAAGYNKDMDRFILSNPGLQSRFTKEILFEDYAPDELLQIFLSMVKAKGMQMAEGSEPALLTFFTDLYTKRDAQFANGRTVRNLFEKGLQAQSSRLMALRQSGQPIDNLLSILEPADIGG
jgi:SpoVK/Ycf46/Vps4 family AAA+-type ATPase